MSQDSINKVLYIAGPGRSGSTLLEMLLGQLDKFWPTGELRFIWKRAFRQNQLCSCGNPFRECDFWTEVIKEVFSGFQNVNYERFEEMRNSAERRISNGLSIHTGSDLLAPYQEYLDAYREIFQAIRKLSGCEFIVDSSKKAVHGFILDAVPEIELFAIHLIRDSRAVAYSWQRKKLRPEIYWKQQHMSHRGILKSCSRWSSRNILAHKLQGTGKQYTILRYEDLVTKPKENLSKQLANLGMESPSLDFLNDFQAKLKLRHTVSGNPIRFEREEINIRPDMQWQTDMPKNQKWLVTLLTWPLLWKYGYLKGSRSRNKAVSPLPEHGMIE